MRVLRLNRNLGIIAMRHNMFHALPGRCRVQIACSNEYSHLLAVLSNPLTRVALLVLCLLSLLHWAHRFRHTLNILLRLKSLNVPIGILCYGAAITGSVWAAFVLFQ